MRKQYLTEMLQVPGEIDRLAMIVRSSGARSFLEIGSKFGGSLWRISSVMPIGSRIVSIDLPHGTGRFAESEPSLSACVRDLISLGYEARILWGSSTAPSVIQAARTLGPYDAIFIDANHTAPFVLADWQNYRAMATKLIAFHDIAWKRPKEWKGTRIDVPEFWATVKGDFKHEEICLDRSGQDNGIGVLWL